MSKFDFKKIVSKETAKKVGATVVKGVRHVVPQKADQPEQWFFKVLVLSLLAVMALGVSAGVAGFLLTLKEPEDVVVPAVTGKELADAIEEVQQAGLNPWVQRRYFSSPESRGRIMEQDPREGTGVKVGRKVTLTLSLGAALDKVGDYAGKNLEQVKEDLRTAFGPDNPLISIGQITYTFDDSEPGTILSQDPAVGTQLSRPIQLGLLVSKGKDETLPVVPELVGLPYLEAMQRLEEAGIPFVWTLAEGHSDYQSASVITQDPAGASTLPKGKILRLALTPPLRVTEGSSFGMFRKVLPEYAVPVDIMVQVRREGHAAETLYRFKSNGGELSFPYMVEEGSEIVLFVYNKEVESLNIPKAGT